MLHQLIEVAAAVAAQQPVVLAVVVLLLSVMQTLMPQLHRQPDRQRLLLLAATVITLGPETVRLRSEVQHGSLCKT
jgi:hypothetical protein